LAELGHARFQFGIGKCGVERGVEFLHDIGGRAAGASKPVQNVKVSGTLPRPWSNVRQIAVGPSPIT
jgi:hypothetical protein